VVHSVELALTRRSIDYFTEELISYMPKRPKYNGLSVYDMVNKGSMPKGDSKKAINLNPTDKEELLKFLKQQ
jgi:hypothetical protein